MNTEIKSAEECLAEVLGYNNLGQPLKDKVLKAMEIYHNQFKSEPIKSNEGNVWVKIEDDLPPLGTMVDGYNKNWINEDFNPEGIREVFLHPHYKTWFGSRWDNDMDCWAVDYSGPTHWKRRTPPVEDLLRDFFLDYSK